MNAGFCDAVFLVVGGHLAEARVDQTALEPSRATFCHFGKTFLVLHTQNTIVQKLIGDGNLSLGVFVGVKLEARQADIGLGHLHAEAGVKIPTLLLQGLTEDVLGEATFVAAGASKINVWL